jgi:hypothetical protein
VADTQDIPTKTITLPADQWQAILDAVECHWDEGPPGEGWQSPLLSTASTALSAALAQPGPAPAPAGSLVEGVEQALEDHHVVGAIEGSWDAQSRAAIRLIAGELRAQCFVHAADLLEQEAGQ